MRENILTTPQLFSEPPRPHLLLHSVAVADEVTDTWTESDCESTDLEVEYHLSDEERENETILQRIQGMGIQQSTWTDDIEFYSYALGFLISPDAIVSAIYGYIKFGGGYIWPLLIASFFIGAPVMFMELALGQYTSSSSISIFRLIAPIMSGLRYVMFVFNTVVFLNDFSLFSMTMAMIQDLIGSKFSPKHLGAMKCTNYWNELTCKELNNVRNEKFLQTDEMLYTNIQGKRAQNRWYVKILQNDMNAQTSLRERSPVQSYLVTHIAEASLEGGLRYNWPSTEMLLHTAIIAFTIMMLDRLTRKSLAQLSKISVLLVVIFPTTIILAQRASRVQVIFPAPKIYLNWLSFDLWCYTIIHMAVVLKIGQGGLCSLGSMNRFRNGIFKHVIVLTSISILLTYSVAVVTFPFMHNLYIQMVVKFNKYTLESNTYWADYDKSIILLWSDILLSFFTFEEFGPIGILFLFTTSVVFFCNKTIRYKMVVQAIEEHYPSKTAQSVAKTAAMTFFLLVFLAKVIVATRTTGFYATQGVALMIVIFEVVAVFYFYGINRFMANVSLMLFGISKYTTKKVPRFLSLIRGTCLYMLLLHTMSVVPLVCLIFYVYLALRYYHTAPDHIHGLVMPLSTVIFLPFFAIYRHRAAYKRKLVWNLFKPVPILWGPRKEFDRRMAEYEERQIRI